ncbi:MAG: DeoR/GlpR family DNA-binding transcription regulator [Candidatus Promineifilaceae bacterium]|nr:DeoR/GlpR family DNA-binding transcription regulator [Candidatus Promineifilaceae bacterium]
MTVVQERQDQIIAILMEQQSVTVDELSRRFDVSTVTIRHDLNHMADRGRIVRTHGGARIGDSRDLQEIAFSKRQQTNMAEKSRIGRLAASLVQTDESILLDGSSTAVAVAAALRQRAELGTVTVVTTGIWTALEMLGATHLDVVLAGGHLRDTTGTIGGMIAKDVLSRFRFQKGFLGAFGLTVEDGLMDGPLADLELKLAAVPRCQEVIAIVDSSKFGRMGLASFAATEEICTIITGPATATEHLTPFQRAGINIEVADTA